MLNKNLFRVFSLFSFVMFFGFALVPFDCLASNQNEKTPNGYTPNNYVSNTDAENKNEEEKETYAWLEEILEELDPKAKNDSEEEEEEEECGEGYNLNTEEEYDDENNY